MMEEDYDEYDECVGGGRGGGERETARPARTPGAPSFTSDPLRYDPAEEIEQELFQAERDAERAAEAKAEQASEQGSEQGSEKKRPRLQYLS